MKTVEKKDQWNKLLKIKILKQGDNQWELRCTSDKTGNQVRKGEIIFRGSEDEFKLLLRRLKASDTETTPDGTKNITYQKMIDLADNPKGNFIWVKTKNWSEYKNGKKLMVKENKNKIRRNFKMSPYVKELAKEIDKSIEDTKKLWDEAIQLTEQSYGIKHDDFDFNHFNYVKKTVYNILQKEEHTDVIQKFIESNESTSQFIKEYVQSADFGDVLDTTIINKNDDENDENKDDDKDDDNEFSMEKTANNKNNKQYEKEELKQFPIDEIFETADGIVLSIFDPYGKLHYVKASSIDEAKKEGWDVVSSQTPKI